MVSLSWTQVNAWRLAQHGLSPRAERQDMLDLVSRICGVHAQLMSAAELALAARIEGLTLADVQNALWHDRTLVKTWAMRGTLHLLTATDFPLYVSALSTIKNFKRQSWLRYFGVTLNEMEALLEGVKTTLTDSGMTREVFATTIAEKTNTPKLADKLTEQWGTLLKPAAFQGDLAFGPSDGQKVTFVRPAAWIGEWKSVDSQQALRELARRYLNAYGPATIDDLARWWTRDAAQAKRILKSLGDEIELVDVEGWEAWALASTVPQMETINPSSSVRLLPHFDPYVVGISRDCESILASDYKEQVHRQQGWISPVVLVDGRMEGVWEYEKKHSQVAVRIEMFTLPTNEVKYGIKAEAQRLGTFLGGDVVLSYA